MPHSELHTFQGPFTLAFQHWNGNLIDLQHVFFLLLNNSILFLRSNLIYGNSKLILTKFCSTSVLLLNFKRQEREFVSKTK